MSPRDRRLLTIVLIFAVVVLAVNFLIPSGGSKNQAELLPTAKAEQDKKVALRTLARLREDKDVAAEEVDRLTYNIPADEIVPRVIRELQAICKKADVHIREIKPLRAKPLASGEGESVPLEVRFRAPFQSNVIRFLYYIEDPKSKMVVEKFNITSAEARLKTVDVSAQISVFTRAASAATSKEGVKSSDASTKKQL